MRPVLVDLTGSLAIMAVLFVGCRALFTPAQRLHIWTFLFAMSAIGSFAHLFSTNIVWSTYHLMWVLAGIAAVTHWWRVRQPERLRRGSNPGPSA